MLTLKVKYETDSSDILRKYIRQYNSVFRVSYNYMKDEPELNSKFSYLIQESSLMNKLISLNNVDLILENSILLQNAISNAYASAKCNEEQKAYDKKRLVILKDELEELNEKYKSMTSNSRKKRTLHNKIQKVQKKITYIENKKYVDVFGGKKLMNNWRSQKQKKDNYKGVRISDEQFYNSRLTPLSVAGHAANTGNRMFRIQEDCETVKVNFIPGIQNSIFLKLIGLSKKQQDIIKRLYESAQNKEQPITFSIDNEYVYISYDEAILYKKEQKTEKIKNRILAIDLNPNYLGWVVIDWLSSDKYKIIASGVYSIKQINDEFYALNNNGIPSTHPFRIHNSNKRTHEIFEITNNLIHIANYYRVSLFAYEKLEFLKKDRQSRKLNALCNNLWNREKMVQNIVSKCNIHQIKTLAVDAKYSSMYGNIIYRKENLPDMVLAAMEISRRGYEFYNQYITKEKEVEKNIIHPKSSVLLGFGAEALEAFGIEKAKVTKGKDIIKILKDSGVKYRVGIERFDD